MLLHNLGGILSFTIKMLPEFTISWPFSMGMCKSAGGTGGTGGRQICKNRHKGNQR